MLRLKHKLTTLINALGILLLLIMFAAPAYAADIPAGCPGSKLQGPPAPGVCQSIPAGCPGATQQGPPAPGTSCPYGASTADGNLSGDCSGDTVTKDNCGIVAYLVLFIRVLSGLVGIVVVIMITVAGVQYSAARDNPQAVAAAKGRITNAVIALILFLFMFSFLQYLIPGGLL